MPTFSAFDSACMARALRLAGRGRYTAHPNPMVGCVLARDGEVIGEGWHRLAGEAHAEVAALAAAGDARHAVAYVTLEPCAHHGRTPPCTDALIAAGIAEVVYAAEDPFEGTGTRGHNVLRDAGIKVRHGLMADAARRQNRGFLSRIGRGRPFVRLKIAASLDGAIAMQDGTSQWISGPESRADVQRLRAASGAILSGVGTVLADDPAFTVRDAAIDNDGRQPLRAILDSTLRMPLSSRMLCLPGDTLVFCSDAGGRAALEAAGAEVIEIGRAGGHLDAGAALAGLARRGINDVLVEAGPTLAGSLLAAGLVDELVIYQAPHIMGSETITMFSTPDVTTLAGRRELVVTDSRRIGADTRITAQIK